MINKLLRFNNLILNEMSISDNNINKHKNVLNNILDYKLVSNHINEIILNLKNSISHLGIELDKNDEDDTYLLYNVAYDPDSEYNIKQLKNILRKSKNTKVYDTYLNMIYPDGNKIDFETEIEIEKNNMNRVHVPIGLPYILKGIGIGKKIYKLLIYELGYISSMYNDRTMESLYVWDSIRKDNSIYTFIKNESIIGISPEMKFEDIENILSYFYKNITDEVVIMDDDFKDKFSNKILKSKMLYNILNYEINQAIQERNNKT